MNPRLLFSLLPVAIFYVLYRADFPTWVAISGGFACSAVVLYFNRRDRLIGILTLFGFVIVAASAVVGVVWSSEKAYLASGPISDFLFVPLYAGSIVLRQPLVGGISRELFPAIAGRLPPSAPLFVRLSIAWALFDLIHGAIRTWQLANLSVGEYIIWSRVVGWPLSGTLLAVTAFLIYREARRLEPGGDGTVAAAEAAGR
ncbi:MAG: hypothetical protein ACR2HN_07730 [Tepidiformaceae bacterium]